MSCQLCGTVCVCTTDCRLSLIVCNRVTARRAYGRKFKRHGIFSVFLNGQNFGNNLACFSDYNRISYANAFFIYKILVVKCGTAYCCSGKKYGFKVAYRSKHTCSADIDFNIEKFSRLLLGRILICLRPFRIFCGTAEKSAACKAVNLDNSAVNCIIKLSTHISYTLNFLNHLVNIIVNAVKCSRKAEFRKIVKPLNMAFNRHPSDLLDIEHEYIKTSLSGYFCIFLTK